MTLRRRNHWHHLFSRGRKPRAKGRAKHRCHHHSPNDAENRQVQPPKMTDLCRLFGRGTKRGLTGRGARGADQRDNRKPGCGKKSRGLRRAPGEARSHHGISALLGTKLFFGSVFCAEFSGCTPRRWSSRLGAAFDETSPLILRTYAASSHTW